MANIPPLSSSIPAVILKPLQALKQTVSNMVTPGDLVKAGIATTNSSGGLSAKAVTPTYAIPNAITGLTATGAFASIILGWSDPSSQVGFAYTNIYRASVDDVGQAVLIGSSAAPIFSDIPPNSSLSVTYYYWVRGVNKDGIEGAYNQTAGTAGSTASDPAYAMDLIAGQISTNELTAALNSRINLVDTPTTGLIDNLTQEVTDRTAAILSEANARVAADTIIQSDISTLQANGAANAASITSESIARSNADAALTAQVTTAQSTADARISTFYSTTQPTANAVGDLWFDTSNGNLPHRWDGTTWIIVQDACIIANAASIATEQTTRASADSATAADITTLKADVVTANANISSNATNLVSTDANVAINTGNISSNASAITNLQSSVAGNTASISTEATTRASNDAANTNAINTLSTTVGGHTTSIQTMQTSINGIEASYSVRIDANGKIAGFGLINGVGAPSLFEVVADKFAIVKPDGTGTVIPFVVDATTGITYMDTAMIQDATITNAKMANLAVDTANIATGAITTAKIGLAQVTGAEIASAQITGAHIAGATITDANIATATITGAKIDSATISKANIGIGEVDTLRIGANAATAAVSGTSSNDQAFATIVLSQPALVQAIGKSSMNTSGTAKLQQGPTLGTLLDSASTIGGTTVTLIGQIQLPAGTHQFRMLGITATSIVLFASIR